jgi:hypothetical protein
MTALEGFLRDVVTYETRAAGDGSSSHSRTGIGAQLERFLPASA